MGGRARERGRVDLTKVIEEGAGLSGENLK